ncbi:MAG: serine hydrolase domain-containing protein [Caldilineaceae bacterium]
MQITLPESVGFSSQHIADIDTAIQSRIALGQLAGLTAMVARQGKIVYQTAHGMSDIATKQPMLLDTIFRIASMTKPITSVAVMMLYEEGYFDLDTPISSFIPAFHHVKVITAQTQTETDLVLADLDTELTIRHLFTQTSGLDGYFEDGGTPIEQVYHQERAKLLQTNPPLTLKKMMEVIATLPLAHQPGARWAYGLGLDVLAYLVELISGMRYEEFLQTRIFAPLKMVDTAYHVPPRNVHRLARVHQYTAQHDQLKRQEFDWMQVPSSSPSYVEGGNLLVSTLGDYGRFLQMLLNKGEFEGVRLLRPDTVDQIASNHVPINILRNGFPDIRDGYGFGLGVRVRMDETASSAVGSRGEYGWGGLYNTVFWVDPQKSLFGLLLQQQFGFSFAREFKTMVYQALLS